MSHGNVSLKLNRKRQKQVIPKCAESRSYCAHQNRKVTMLQSCLNSKGHGNHQETRGKEILTKGVVLKHIKAVATVSVR